MWKNIKKGFGLAVGATIGTALVSAICEKFLEWRANDNEVFEKAKSNDRRKYELLKKYRYEKEESVEEEEES